MTLIRPESCARAPSSPVPQATRSSVCASTASGSPSASQTASRRGSGRSNNNINLINCPLTCSHPRVKPQPAQQLQTHVASRPLLAGPHLHRRGGRARVERRQVHPLGAFFRVPTGVRTCRNPHATKDLAPLTASLSVHRTQRGPCPDSSASAISPHQVMAAAAEGFSALNRRVTVNGRHRVPLPSLPS